MTQTIHQNEYMFVCPGGHGGDEAYLLKRTNDLIITMNSEFRSLCLYEHSLMHFIAVFYITACIFTLAFAKFEF